MPAGVRAPLLGITNVGREIMAESSGGIWLERFALSHCVAGPVVFASYALTAASWSTSLGWGQAAGLVWFAGWSLLVWVKRLRSRNRAERADAKQRAVQEA